MAWELVYTSSAGGLAPGSRGFCTVAASHGLPGSLASRLEALSGYRPRYGAVDPADAVHPVQYTHVLLDHGGQRLSLLSRIAHAGADYSGRTNKLADHRVLSPEERAEAGPAWVQAHPGAMRTDWNESPQVLPETFEVPRGDVAAGICERWERAAGDAGWAGVLIEQFLLDPCAPFYVVYDPCEHDPLKLIGEAILLLPVARRWDVTFATYYTDPVGESGVAWRFVVAGTAAAEQAVAVRSGMRFVDLTGSPGSPEASRYVQFARDGVEPERGPSAVSSEMMQATEASVLPIEAADAQAENSTEPCKEPASSPEASAEITRTHQAESHAALSPVAHAVSKAGEPSRWPVAAVLLLPVLIAGALYLFWPPQRRADAKVMEGNAISPAVIELQVALQDERQRSELLQQRLDDLESILAQKQAQPLKALPVVPVLEAASTVESVRVVSADPEVASAVHQALPMEIGLDQPGLDPVALHEPAVLDVFAELPRPVLETMGSMIVGASSRLSAERAVLWESGAGLPAEARLWVTPPAVVDEDFRVSWERTATGAWLQVQSVDTLGAQRLTRIGQVEISASGLVWSWTGVELPRRISERLEETWRFAAATVFEVVDTSGTVVARVQGLVPKQEGLSAGGAAVMAAQARSPLALRLEGEQPDPAWSVKLGGDGQRVELTGAGGARLEVVLLGSLREPGRVSARWAQDLARLESELAAVRRRSAEAEAWVTEHDRLQKRKREAAVALPRTPDEEIDHDQRIKPRMRPAFEKYDQASATFQDFLGQHPGRERTASEREVARLHRVVQTLETRIAAIARFPGADVRVVAEGSGAVLAVLRVGPEVKP